jgi:hypothetical protein
VSELTFSPIEREIETPLLDINYGLGDRIQRAEATRRRNRSLSPLSRPRCGFITMNPEFTEN